MYIFKYQNEQLDTVGIVDMADNPPLSVNKDNGIIWVKTENNDLLYVSENKLKDIVSVEEFIQAKPFSGNNFGIIKAESGLYFTLGEKVYKFDKSQNIFVEEKINSFRSGRNSQTDKDVYRRA